MGGSHGPPWDPGMPWEPEMPEGSGIPWEPGIILSTWSGQDYSRVGGFFHLTEVVLCRSIPVDSLGKKEKTWIKRWK